jgi:hypothetical protein
MKMTIRAVIVDYFTEEGLSTHWVKVVDLQDFVKKEFDYYNQENRKIEIKISKIS